MIAIGLLFVRMLCDCFKSRPRLEAEILVLRHQLNVLQQHTPRRRLHLCWIDRAQAGAASLTSVRTGLRGSNQTVMSEPRSPGNSDNPDDSARD